MIPSLPVPIVRASLINGLIQRPPGVFLLP